MSLHKVPIFVLFDVWVISLIATQNNPTGIVPVGPLPDIEPL